VTGDTPATVSRVVTPDALTATVQSLLDASYQPCLVAAHQDPDHIRVVYVLTRASDNSRIEVHVLTDATKGQIPSLAGLSFPIGRFEREIRDLYGVTPSGHPMPYRLVRHAHWPRGWYPMLSEAEAAPAFDDDAGAYPFAPVEGAGVYEIPVGPVHAGLIEPGHFRFSVIGETILRMKARLWFLHRGIERLFQGRSPDDGIELAERISGDTAVGHTLAYCIAVEEALKLDVPEPARLQRALLLELERIYNHIGDLGAMANDVGFSFGNAHAFRLRETMLRLNERTTGHRLLRGGVRIGGAQLLAVPDPAALRSVGTQVDELVDITLSKSTVMDRFTDTAVLTHDAALEMGTLGYVARASGIDRDARRDHPFTSLPDSFQIVTEESGDVLARYRIRVRELAVSVHLVQDLARQLASGSNHPITAATTHAAAGSGLGLVEGWRGRIAHRVELAPDATVARVKIVDPSFLNWPALSIALADTIVPDFPLANKSFNQSYAGNDL
jgi:Ni,Fe-hydrogenase III large subunit/Ni,Fe-hydrogenase III component G